MAFAVFLETRVSLLGQYEARTPCATEELGVEGASRFSLRGRSGGSAGSAIRGVELWRSRDASLWVRLLDALRGSSLAVLLRVRVLPDELEGREGDCWDSGCCRCWRCDRDVDGS